ncbi:TetR/AcrR family transcriptional regulator [Lactobacillus psittaci]|nr:TetR/AcrR family transcriptional regulator [Lactobacillus psittaci]
MVKSTFENLKQEKKARITQALLKEFSNHPLADTQVARIVADSEIARGAFYKYFDDLEDAYKYVYKMAIKEIHAPMSMREFNPDLICQLVSDFVTKSEASPYYDLIKMHLSKNESLVAQNLQQKAVAMSKLGAKEWSAMVLSHETIKLALFDPEHRSLYLDRLRKSIELLGKGD